MAGSKQYLYRKTQSKRRSNTSWIRVFILMCLSTEYSVASICQTIDGTIFPANTLTKTKFSLSLKNCNTTEISKQDPVLFEAGQLSLYEQRPRQLIETTTIAIAEKNTQNNQPAKPFFYNIQMVAEKYDIDPLLLHAIAHVESRHNPKAVSHAGALGLMQVMPATARRFGVMDPELELHDPLTNLKVSSAYLKTLQSIFGNNLHLVLAAYNAGEGAVIKYGRNIPPYQETQNYVRKVIDHYLKLKQHN